MINKPHKAALDQGGFTFNSPIMTLCEIQTVHSTYMEIKNSARARISEICYRA